MTVGLFAQSSAYSKIMINLQYMALGVARLIDSTRYRKCSVFSNSVLHNSLINLLPLFCNLIGLVTPGKLSGITLIARSFWYPHHHCLVC